VCKIFAQPLWGIIADSTSLQAALILSLVLCSVSLEAVRLALVYKAPFLTFVVLRSLRSASNGMSPIADAILVKSAKVKKEGYGKQKLFSSLGWGIGAFLYGWIVDAFGLYAIFYSSYIFCIICIIIVLSMDYVGSKYDKTNADAGISESSDVKTSPYKNYKKSQSPSLVLRNTYILLKQPGISFFATQFFIFGFVMVLADCILYMQLEQEFKVSRKFNGLTTLISTLSALPTYWFAEKLLNSKGALYMLRTAQKIAMFRFLCTGFLNERLLFLLLPLQLLHGISFAMNWSAGVEILQSAATPLIVASVSKISFFVSTYEKHILPCAKLLTRIAW
jgi:MFS family permease